MKQETKKYIVQVPKNWHPINQHDNFWFYHYKGGGIGNGKMLETDNWSYEFTDSEIIEYNLVGFKRVSIYD